MNKDEDKKSKSTKDKNIKKDKTTQCYEEVKWLTGC